MNHALCAIRDYSARRAATKFTSEDIHQELFGKRTPKKRTIKELKEGIREYIRNRYSR